jgi:hypothetical protein
MAIVDKEQWRREQERRIQSKLPKPQLNGEHLVRSIEDLIQQQRARRAKPISDNGLDVPRGLKDPLV